jgi:hypothetical protein
MKKIVLMLLVTITGMSSFSQYKKASFFNKEGRTHELGTNISFIKNGGGTPVLSIVYTGSLETEKKISLFSDIEFMMKGKMSYTGEYYKNAVGATVTEKLTGKTPIYLLVKYGLQYRFTNTENGDDSRLVPYVRAGILYGINFGSDYKLRNSEGEFVSGDNVNPATPQNESVLGLETGAGATYYFTQNLGIRAGINYRYFIHYSGIGGRGNTDNVFYPLKVHPGISISLKYRIFAD